MSDTDNVRPKRLSDGTLTRVETLHDDDPIKLPWQDFESEVADHLEQNMSKWHLGLDGRTAKVRRKPRYYSNDRESEIEFDVSIEIFANELAERPILLLIFECKRYPDLNVQVNEVEEFREKLRQVGAHKGTIVTLKGFAKGAISLAKSSRIALAVLEKQEISYVMYSAVAQSGRRATVVATWSLDSQGKIQSGDNPMEFTTYAATEIR